LLKMSRCLAPQLRRTWGYQNCKLMAANQPMAMLTDSLGE